MTRRLLNLPGRRRSLVGAVIDICLILLAAAALGTTIVLYARDGFIHLWFIANSDMGTHYDFNVFWHSAKALLEGRNIYFGPGAQDSSNNPPIWTVIVSPVALLEEVTAYRTYVVVLVLVALASLAWMAGEIGLHGRWATVATGALLVSSPMLGTLWQGQVCCLLTFGLVTAWITDRRDMPFLSGCALGLVVAVKPSLAPVVLWPVMRRRWGTFAVAVTFGVAATLMGEVIAGPGTTLDWLRVMGDKELDGYWDNASLPGSASRLFRENDYSEPLAIVPGALTAAVVLGLGLIAESAWASRRDPEMGLWALAAASLLASPVSWHNYLTILGPGVLLLLARGRRRRAACCSPWERSPYSMSPSGRGDHGPRQAGALALHVHPDRVPVRVHADRAQQPAPEEHAGGARKRQPARVLAVPLSRSASRGGRLGGPVGGVRVARTSPGN